MFDIIKQRYQDWQLKKLLKTPRDKRIKKWNDIKSVGLIFVVGDAVQWNILNRFISTQTKQGKSISIIGLHPKDFVIDYIFTYTETTLCREKEDLNFWELPKKGVIDNFTNRHYDLLIDASNVSFFDKYVTASSNADLKVGYRNMEQDNETLEMYDITIQGNGDINIKDYLEQVVKYLTMIKK